jgi:hypothetical protein
VKNNSLQIPAPRPGVDEWPVVGKKIHDVWSKAHADLPALVQSMQPKIGELAKTALSIVASIGGALLQLIASFALPMYSFSVSRGWIDDDVGDIPS